MAEITVISLSLVNNIISSLLAAQTYAPKTVCPSRLQLTAIEHLTIKDRLIGFKTF